MSESGNSTSNPLPDGIVVGVDLSEHAADSLRWAVAEGSARGWPVTAVMVWDYLNQHHLDPKTSFDPSYDEARAQDALDHAIKAAVGRDAGGVARLTPCDRPASALLDASTNAKLLVVGARGMGGFRGMLLGSVSSSCLHHAKVPVAIIRPGAVAHGRGHGRVVVGVDGSPTARAALIWAANEARARVIRLDIVNAWHLPPVGDALYAAPMLDPKPFEDASERLLAELRSLPDVEMLTTKVTTRSVSSGAVAAMLDAAQDADLVVVGSRGLGGFAGLLLGSVTHQLAHHCPCPLIVIPHQE